MPKPAVTTIEAIGYETTTSGIHVVEIRDGSRLAVAALLSIMERLYSDPSFTKGIYILVDATQHTLPLTPTIRQVIQLERKHPVHPPVNTAVMIGLDFAMMVDTMLTPIRSKNPIRLFSPKDRERAMQWLLARQAIDATKGQQGR